MMQFWTFQKVYLSWLFWFQGLQLIPELSILKNFLNPGGENK